MHSPTRTRSRLAVAAGLLSVCLTGCFPEVKHLPPKATIATHSGIEGAYYHVTNKGVRKDYRIAAFPSSPGVYRIIDPKDPKGGYPAMRLHQLGGELFAFAMTGLADGSSEEELKRAAMQADNGWFPGPALVKYSVFKVAKSQSGTSFRPLNDDYFFSNPQALPGTVIHKTDEFVTVDGKRAPKRRDHPLLTASPDQLERFFSLHSNTNGLFRDKPFLSLTRAGS